jgi:hypothetical protein
LDNITKYLNRIAYKFPKGYPDMNNDQDVLLLETLMSELLGEKFSLEEVDATEDLLDGIELLKKELKLTDEYFPLINTKKAKILVPKKERPEFNNVVASIEGFTKDSNNVFKFKNSTFLLKPIEQNKIKKEGEVSIPNTNTDEKEGLVVVFYELLKNENSFQSFNKDNITQLNDIPSTPSKSVTIALGSEISSIVSTWIQNAKNILNSDNPDPKYIKLIIEELNNAYATGKVLASSYPDSRAIRDESFESIRNTAKLITGLPQDKWNPGDIYLYHEGDISTASSKEQLSIGPINDLFNDEWGATDKPLTAISLKKEQAQPGRAKTFVNRFPKEDVDAQGGITQENDIKIVQEEINKERTKAESITGKYESINVIYNIKESNSKESLKNKRRKLASLKLFNYLLNVTPQAPLSTFLGMFAYGEGLDQEKKVNPTFFKLTGSNKGADASIKRYPRGATVEFEDNSSFIIQDSINSGGIVMKATIKVSGENNISQKPYTLNKAIRTSANNEFSSVGIV